MVVDGATVTVGAVVVDGATVTVGAVVGTDVTVGAGVGGTKTLSRARHSHPSKFERARRERRQ